MRRCLGCAVALIVILVGATDPIWCADGCGRTSVVMTATASSSGTAADCPFCSGFVDSAIAPRPVAVVAIAPVDRTLRSLPVFLLTTALHRPPRPTD